MKTIWKCKIRCWGKKIGRPSKSRQNFFQWINNLLHLRYIHQLSAGRRNREVISCFPLTFDSLLKLLPFAEINLKRESGLDYFMSRRNIPE